MPLPMGLECRLIAAVTFEFATFKCAGVQNDLAAPGFLHVLNRVNMGLVARMDIDPGFTSLGWVFHRLTHQVTQNACGEHGNARPSNRMEPCCFAVGISPAKQTHSVDYDCGHGSIESVLSF